MRLHEKLAALRKRAGLSPPDPAHGSTMDGAEGKTFGVTLQSWAGGRVEGYLRGGQLS